MHASGQILENEAAQAARDKANGGQRVGLSPAEVKRRLALKKAKARAAKKGG